MFNVRPNLRVPGFDVREPEEEVPGFRLNADGTIGADTCPFQGGLDQNIYGAVTP